jgi:hypothetical protein
MRLLQKVVSGGRGIVLTAVVGALFLGAIELCHIKNREMGRPFALDGYHLMKGNNNQPQVSGNDGLQVGATAGWAITVVWGVIPSFGPSN